ncbi:MAG: hypothetical protein FJ118_01160 [Deltaproteobacteria bacterium]|nr:hypothetical protein [Deltaproteobacteria bacterium]
MNSCFVMQPFDADVYDKRYDDVFAPAIKEAGLVPYRVDQDPGVSVPIDDIESGIRNAEVCFAEITTDNPNVWFELGFAIAAAKDVVLVCSEERKSHFPFDVRHRSIIKYRTGSPQDFAELQTKITKRISSILKKQEEIGRAASISPVKDTEGLSQHEIVALVTVMQNQFMSGEFVAAWTVKNDMNKAGFTDIAVSLAMKLLSSKGMVVTRELQDEHENTYRGFAVTDNGETWLMANQERIVLKSEP